MTAMENSRKLWNGYTVHVWPLAVLLTAQILYLLAEIGFNAALLNVASGATGSVDQIDELEIIGRLLAGVGLALLLIGIRMSRIQLSQFTSSAVAFRFVTCTALLLPFSLWFMWHLQIALIERFVVERADQQEHYAASYVQYLTPAIRQGVIGLEQVPIASEDLNRADIKTLLTLLGPALLTNDGLVEDIARAGNDIVKFAAHSKASGTLDQDYDQFLAATGAIEAAWENYRGQADQLQQSIPNETAQLVSSPGYRQTVKRMETVDNRYRMRERDFWSDLDGRIEQTLNNMHRGCSMYNSFRGQFESIMRLGRTDTALCHLNRPESQPGGARQRFYDDFGFYPTFEFYCPQWKDRKTCLSDDQVRAAALKTWERTPASARKAYFDHHQRWAREYVKAVPPGLSPIEVFNHPAVKRHLGLSQNLTVEASDLARSLDRHGNAQIRADGLARKAVIGQMNDKLAQSFAQQLDRQHGAGIWPGNLRPQTTSAERIGLSERQFMNSPAIQKAFFGQPLSIDAPGVELASVSREQFFTEEVLPRTYGMVDSALVELPRSPDAVDKEASSQALRAIYVPAIALGFSLFFSVLNALSAVWRLISIGAIYKPQWEDAVGHRRLNVIKLAALVAIMNLPAILPGNPIFHSQVMLRALEQSNLEVTTGAVDWVLAVQPVIFPIGHTMVKVYDQVTGANLYDQQSVNAGTGKARRADAVSLEVPLTVEHLQRLLKSQGHYSGAIDGVIGPNTIDGIRGFQREAGLPVTGVQNPDTIRAIRLTEIK
jgi:hypothetical protein